MSTNKIMLISNNEVIGHSTDTVFGLIAKFDKQNISKINSLKERESDQPLQILISSVEEIKDHLLVNEFITDYLENKLEPNTSYIVKVNDEFANKYLTESFNKTIMFRIPMGEIKDLLNEYKILFATSANKHEKKPVNNEEEFINDFPGIHYFGNEFGNKASKIISLVNNKEEIIRE